MQVQERVGEVCEDLAQWLEQLAMLLSLSASLHFRVCSCEAVSGRGDL